MTSIREVSAWIATNGQGIQVAQLARHFVVTSALGAEIHAYYAASVWGPNDPPLCTNRHLYLQHTYERSSLIWWRILRQAISYSTELVFHLH